MHIHLPKVLHNWREVAGEIGIIVVGILIALFLEQLVQGWEWREKVRAADEAMREELMFDNGPQIYQRAAMHPCIVARLDAVRAAVESGKDRDEIGRLIDGYWVQHQTFDKLAHDNATAVGVFEHMRPERLKAFTYAYVGIPLMDRTNAQEAVDVGRLHAFRRSGGAVSDEEADRLLVAIEALRNDDRIMWLAAKWTIPQIRKLGQLDPERTRSMMANARRHYGGCVKDLPSDFPTSLSPEG